MPANPAWNIGTRSNSLGCHGMARRLNRPGTARLSKPASSLDRSPASSRVALPSYVRAGVDAYIEANPGSNLRSVALEGFRKLGIVIEDGDMQPGRARRQPSRADTDPDAPDALLGTVIVLPRYVRGRVEAYALDHKMRFRQVVMAGFQALGIKVEDADLIAERPTSAGAFLRDAG